MHRRVTAVIVALVAGLTGGVQASTPTRVKDVASLVGVRPSPLIGYGLVVGLNRTGDRRQTLFSTQSLASTLERFGVVVTPELMKVENIAAVMVTAELPPFARQGVRLDVTVSSIGDARSLQGGTLLATPLRGVDGQVVALAQGPLTLGGFGGGTQGNSVQVNHLTAGRVPGGAMVQTAPRGAAPSGDELLLALHTPDFTTAHKVARVLDAALGEGVARALDPATVQIRVPEGFRGQIPELMARIEPLAVETDDPARVVINERTGTVVIGANVKLSAAAVAHGTLSVRISTRFDVSQPAPLSRRGETVVVPQEQVDVREGDARLVALSEGTDLDAVVRALNALGATPRDVIAIVQALKVAGALRAELVII
jgi:flagellar P-ring protein precursor FlgI